MILSAILPGWAKYAALAALALSVWGHGYITASQRAEGRLEALRAAEAIEYLKGVERAAKINDRVIYQYIDRWRVVVEKGKTIIKEVPKYVSVESDRACPIPLGFVRLHNAAARQATLPESTIDINAAAAGITLSRIAGTVTENYTTCHATREQLIALQTWANSGVNP